MLASKRDPLTRPVEAVPSSFIPHGRVIDETQSSDDDEDEDGDDDDDDDDSNDDGDDNDADVDDSVDDDTIHNVQADEETPVPAQHPSQEWLPLVPQPSVPPPIDLKANQEGRKSDECEEVLEDPARRSGGTMGSEDARAFDRAQRDYHFSRLLSWEAALREREDRLLLHSSTTNSSTSSSSSSSRHSSTPIEGEKASGSGDSPLPPHIHIHNHLPSPSPIPPASIAIQAPKPTVVPDEDNSRTYDRWVVPSQMKEGTSDGKTVMRPSSTPLGQQSNRDNSYCKDNVLHSSIDLSGLSLEVGMRSITFLLYL